jgi:stress response protein YsnF
MITKKQIPTVLAHPVYDADGNKIGEAQHVYLDDATGKPEWVAVKTGFFGSRESFVPVHDATLSGDHLDVPYSKEKVKDAPNVDVESGGHLSEEEEHRLYDYYGIDWDAAWQEAQRTEGTRPNAGMPPTGETDDAMTRSEERLHVGTERHEVGRARLRKYVVTEEEQVTVPVRKEKVRIEREPISEANRDAAMGGEPIGEAEHEVTLHEDKPVVETRAEPVERVRMTAEEHTEEETVRGRVRKERIDAEADMRTEDDTPER